MYTIFIKHSLYYTLSYSLRYCVIIYLVYRWNAWTHTVHRHISLERVPSDAQAVCEDLPSCYDCVQRHCTELGTNVEGHDRGSACHPRQVPHCFVYPSNRLSVRLVTTSIQTTCPPPSFSILIIHNWINVYF